MSLSLVQSRALVGLEAVQVTVEVHLANGLPSFTLVGLADVEVKEARERVRCAIQNSGLEFPNNKRITVNLAPADLPKDSGRLDLPIALGILAASGQIDATQLQGLEFAGELSLSGELRPVRGALAMALALRRQSAHSTQATRLVLPAGSAEEAALVPDTEVYRALHLLDAVQALRPAAPQDNATRPTDGWVRLQGQALRSNPHYADLADVKGQTAAKRVLEIAAAGGHSLLMVGPPGSGKSMLAQRFAGLLPPMDAEQALESAAIASLSGRFKLEHWGQRPTCQPHHSASAVALVGGGSPPRPGEISLAHHGVLFLDELPEFPRAALEALREPLETGHITIARATRRADFPARFQLIAAMNPCPCGYLGSRIRVCRCTPDQVARYQGKLSGPLLDRIDLHLEVPALPAQELLHTSPGEGTAAIAQRCDQARQLAKTRQGCTNAALQGQAIDEHVQLESSAASLLNKAAAKMAWSARSTHRTLKVARTIADLAASTSVQASHVAEAIQYRHALKSAAL
ncbi:YifB family Mg chelatase-like AAA ATPase [Curvibacter sp. CHRR-16]|uniref:YifB family Mg chelatase-like AAA ATPase n=1 Tax=Curvibacter sp. CHRR-16 TaxID=2835872 RepID=UPI001BDA4865|nr:YifB family Mg chelatase-like AAA ATPase [Curvibacter sp. CHRR-16]MBT0570103.1 YifB family Mg chelatase-like AAA ATPase [Curvibacter sp. CHRR-16]